LEFFRAALLFICQGAAVLFWRPLPVIASTALISYHERLSLSSTFFYFFTIFSLQNK